jgi:hypothetical protein
MIVGDASVILQFIFKGGRCPYSDAAKAEGLYWQP